MPAGRTRAAMMDAMQDPKWAKPTHYIGYTYLMGSGERRLQGWQLRLTPRGAGGLRTGWESQWQRGAARTRDGIRQGLKAGSPKPLGCGKSGHIASSLAFYFQGILGAGKVGEVPWGKAPSSPPLWERGPELINLQAHLVEVQQK